MDDLLKKSSNLLFSAHGSSLSNKIPPHFNLRKNSSYITVFMWIDVVNDSDT